MEAYVIRTQYQKIAPKNIRELKNSLTGIEFWIS